MTPTDQALWCEACSIHYEVGTLESGRTYRCARCRGAIVAPTDSLGTTWLYAARPSTATAPTLDDARTTWSDTQATTEEMPAPSRFAHYELAGELGRGGMGVVYRAWDPSNQRTVALKVLLGGRWADRTATERFLREAAAARRLDHPGLVRVLDHGEWEGQPWYAMEAIEGPSLKDVLDDLGRPPPEETVRIGAALARALAHAHAHGVSHRDVKPENVLLRVTGEPVLTDFGLVLEAAHARLTHTGQVMGTPAYLAPELARGDKEPDWTLVDVYALGALLYELSTGRPAYDGESGMQVLMDVLEGPPPAPKTLDAAIPGDLDTVIQRAMARFPSERIATAALLAEDLERIRTGARISARPLSAGYRTRLWLERNGRHAGVAAMALTLALGIGGVGYLARQRLAVADRAQAWEDASRRLAELQPELDRMEAEGRRAEVELALEDFAENKRWQDAPAISEAVRLHARRLRDRGDPEGELEALAQAWAIAPTDESAAMALDGLIEALTARWWYDRIESLAVGLPGESLDRRRALGAVARRDLRAARQTWSSLPDGPPPAAPVVEALLVGRATGHRARAVHRLEDGRLLLVGEDGLRVAASNDRLSIEERWDVGREVMDAWPVGRDRLVTWADGRAELLVRSDGAWAPALVWDEARILDATRLSESDDAPILIAIGPYARHLLRLDRVNDVWTARPAHPGTDSVASDVVALEATEVDGDGRPDLLVAAGPWNAFDVRWLTRDATGELSLRSRRKLGFVSDLATLEISGRTLIAAAKSDQFPSRRTFPADHPYGEPAGLYLLDPAAGLATADHRRIPNPVGETPVATSRLFAGDLDGDGRDDLAISARSEGDRAWLLVYRQSADGDLHQARLRGLELYLGIDLDDDRADELIVGLDGEQGAERELWVLGAGHDAVPVLPQVSHQHPSAPETVRGDLARGWTRADRLAASGLHGPAASLFEQLARSAPDAEHRDLALLRAAGLWSAADRPDRSLAVARDVRTGPHQAQAADLQVRALLRAYRFDEARTLDDGLAAQPSVPPEIARSVADRRPLYEMVSSSPSLWLELDRPLEPEWSVVRPLALQRDSRAGALRVDAVVGSGTLAELPLERDGDVLELVVEGEVERVEWAAGIAIVLEPEGGSPTGVRVAGWGGGSLLETQLGCLLPGQGFVGPRSPSVPARPIPFRARIQVAPGLHEITCLVESDGKRLVEQHTALSAPPPDGAWTLDIRSAGEATVATPMHARMRIDRIGLRGFRIGRAGPSGAVGRRYAEGELDGALSELESTDSVLRAALLSELGRTRAASDAMPAIDEADPIDLALLLRARPRVAHDLRSAFGDRWYEIWHRHWNVAIVSHPDDPAILARLDEDLSGLAEWSPTGPRGRAVRIDLLAARGRARWLAGQAAAARADLRLAIEQAEAVLVEAEATADGPGLQSARLVWMDAHAALSAIALAQGDEPEALVLARTSLLHAPFRELAVDRLLLDPRIADRRLEPAWAELLGVTERSR